MKLSSPAFMHEEEIPVRFTCEGENCSPPLEWADVPDATKSFALIVDDPDAPDPAAPKRVFVHWVLVDLPPSKRALSEGLAEGLPPGAEIGRNDWHETSYGGPCPPIGRHRYVHKLYALDTTLGLEHPSKTEVENAMQGHVLAEAELIGTYEKKRA
jgi:Raf kinase inhibitor-like YbhB/YbcL family protein